MILAGCTTMDDWHSAESVNHGKSDSCAACTGKETQTADDSAKKETAQPKPHTLPEALCAYWHCLLCGPPPQDSSAKENGKEKASNNEDAKAKNGSANGKKNEPSKTDNGDKDKKDGDKGKKDGDKDKKDGDKDQEKDNGNDKDKEKDKEPAEAWYSAHAQATFVTMVHSNFNPPYTGTNSLLPNEPMATSMTGTLFLDARLWEGGELIFNPEIAGGRGFSNTLGIAGFPNGEITRVGDVEPTWYFARLFLKQTFSLGGGQEKVEDGPNQIAGTQDVNRLTVSVGKFSATDFFDDNKYSHDPRTQFLSWAIMYNGAWDYPANVRGYTYGVELEYHTKWWTLSYGIFAEPEVANGAALDPHIADANGQALELEQRYEIYDHPGSLRYLAYLNHAHMGNYSEALNAMPVDPNITLTRAYRFKYGFGLSWDQEVTKDLGVFGRLGWDNGQSEAWAFTEVDRLAELGLVLKGTSWCRPNDAIGVAYLIEGLSGPHRDYLGAGGLGFIIGDGQLRYGPEEIVEVFYSFEICKGITFSLDFQEVDHPAYNRDRGPVSIGGMRLHLEY
jgi:high affinity Mn2+ porin